MSYGVESIQIHTKLRLDKRAGSDNWYARLTLPNGKRLVKTTKTDDLETAKEIALRLYYDFVGEANSAPQILAVMHSELEEADWTEVSIGKAGSKKTSNCSLTSQGKAKLIQSTIVKTSLTKYASTFDRLGIY